MSRWVDKGIELKKWVEGEPGARAIEVYPYAARRALDIGECEEKIKGWKERILLIK